MGSNLLASLEYGASSNAYTVIIRFLEDGLARGKNARAHEVLQQQGPLNVHWLARLRTHGFLNSFNDDLVKIACCKAEMKSD